jgi:polysaccharide biosynthesis protein PslF
MSESVSLVAEVPSSAHRPLSVAFVATCPPRQCGIATFTADLAKAVKAADPTVRISWAAINDADGIYPYGPEVRWRIRQGRRDSYREAAEQLNASRVDVVSLQHEFGLYGLWGETFVDHLEPFLETLKKPLVTTLHTVRPEPMPSEREAIALLGRHSRAVVAMANVACDLLVEKYGLDPDVVRVIPHGVPPVEPRGRRRMKERLGLKGRTIISTFGLVDPRKGLEYMIRAMERVVERHPNALYMIVGKTHPELVRRAGEAYRRELSELIESRGLDGHVAFVNQYLTQREIVDYLLASDVYVTPYLDPNQITSGTLAYALGAGKAVVSTPYLHASETLADGRGVLVGFRDADALAEAVLRILDDPDYKRDLEQRAYAYGHEMAWPNVGRRMLDLFRAVVPAVQPATAVAAPRRGTTAVADRRPLVGLANRDGDTVGGLAGGFGGGASTAGAASNRSAAPDAAVAAAGSGPSAGHDGS